MYLTKIELIIYIKMNNNDETSTINNDNKENYIYVDVNNFDINKITLIEDISVDNRFIIKYINDNTNFYIIPDKAFNSYGIKNKYKNINNIGNNNNEKQVSIIMDKNNIHHVNFKNVIDKIYNKINNYFKRENIKVHNPISKKYSVINAEINEKSVLYIYENQVPRLVTFKDIMDRNHVPFKIWPYLYIKYLNKNNNTLYFNFVIKTAIIEFEQCYSSFDKLIYAFSEDPKDNDSINSNNSIKGKGRKLF